MSVGPRKDRHKKEIEDLREEIANRDRKYRALEGKLDEAYKKIERLESQLRTRIGLIPEPSYYPSPYGESKTQNKGRFSSISKYTIPAAAGGLWGLAIGKFFTSSLDAFLLLGVVGSGCGLVVYGLYGVGKSYLS
jgi:hypothetical protein